MNDDLLQQLTVEVQRLNEYHRRGNRLTRILFLSIASVLILSALSTAINVYRGKYSWSEIAPEKKESWRDVEWAIDNLDFERASTIAHRLVDRFPNDYYGHWQLGWLALRTGDMKMAEQHFARVVEIFPFKNAVEELEVVRQRIQKDRQTSPK